MDTLRAVTLGMASRDNPLKVFDWDAAANYMVLNNIKYAAAGLSGDWEYTGGQIFADGKIVPEEDTYTYLASTWATPQLYTERGLVDCWKWQYDTDWDCHTYWPESAREIIKKLTN